NFYFEVIVLQRSRRQSSARFRFVRFLTAAKKTKSNETTKASAILRKWSSADRARAYGWVAFHTGKCEGLINFGSCNRPIPWLIIPAPSSKPKRIRFLCEDLPFLDTSTS